jgi:glutamate formiminotransferase/formiminotetrahydrofolate cyclodeaminase
MMDQLVECVPNFSEGRRPEIIERILSAIREVPGVQLLDVQSDADHNRTVVTMVGPPEVVEEGAFCAIARAAELIDMEAHEGEHPRIGATDVVPFIPVRGVSMETCVELARRLGRRVGEELELPVYLYEAAALRPDRTNLAEIRRGEYEILKAEIGSLPERAPDFGPARMGRAGATVIGARPFLIAFNVYLATDDVAVAKRVARAVRHSSGGLRYVKALGLLVEGQAQVSMNLVDFTRTPIPRVVELIRREAAQHGVMVSHSELVGLAPQQALLDTAAWYLQLDLDPQQVLENRLRAAEPAGSAEGGLESFLDAVASGEPTPGGGSVTALAGALAGGLAAMVARLTLGRERYEEVQPEMERVVEEAERLREALAERVAEDAEAYRQVMAAYRLPKGDEAEKAARRDAIQTALIGAAEVPLATARDSIAVLELAHQAAQWGNPNALTDAGTAAHMAQAAFEGAALNVRINAEQVKDQERVAAWTGELEQLRERCRAAMDGVRRTIEVRWQA